jgi:hypothetical protein
VKTTVSDKADQIIVQARDTDPQMLRPTKANGLILTASHPWLV